MSRQRVRHFLGRLTRLEYLGLHLAVGLVLCVGLVVAFAIVARQVDEAGALTRFDTRLGLRLTADRKAAPLLRTGLMGLTYLSAFEFMLFFVPAVAVLLLL